MLLNVKGMLERFNLAALKEELDSACYRVYPDRHAIPAQQIW